MNIRQFISFSQNIRILKDCGLGIFIIFCRNGGMYRICTSFGSYYNFIMISRWSQLFLVNSIVLWACLTHFCIYIYTGISFVIHNTVRMIILLPITFLKSWIFLCFLSPLWGQQMRYITHDVSILLASSYEF